LRDSNLVEECVLKRVVARSSKEQTKRHVSELVGLFHVSLSKYGFALGKVEQVEVDPTSRMRDDVVWQVRRQDTKAK
jgi:hypothetical protein